MIFFSNSIHDTTRQSQGLLKISLTIAVLNCHYYKKCTNLHMHTHAKQKLFGEFHSPVFK